MLNAVAAFVIQPLGLDLSNIGILWNKSFVYNGKEQTATPEDFTVYLGDDYSQALKAGTDYTVAGTATGTAAGVNPSGITISAATNSNFTITPNISIPFTIEPFDIANAEVIEIPAQWLDNGAGKAEITALTAILFDGVKAVFGTDIITEGAYKDNDGVGTASVTLKAESGNFTGKQKAEFRIALYSLKNVVASKLVQVTPRKGATVTYTGEPVGVSVDIASLVKGTDFEVIYEKGDERIPEDGGALRATTSHDAVTNVGKIAIIANSLGIYAEEQELSSFEITPAAFSSIRFKANNYILAPGETYAGVTAEKVLAQNLAIATLHGVDVYNSDDITTTVNLAADHKSGTLVFRNKARNFSGNATASAKFEVVSATVTKKVRLSLP